MKIIPYTEKHAIKNVLFAFEFATPIPPSVLSELRSGDIHNQLKKNLPRVQELASVTFNVDTSNANGLNKPSVQEHKDVGGFSFDAAKPNGEPGWMVTVEPGLVFVLCGDYQRWAPTWEQAKIYLAIILPWILKHTSINVIALQYIDEFRITENLNPREPLSELFNSESKYIPKNISELNDQFHSHHGYFVYSDDPTPSKMLVNINVNINDQDDQTLASIQTVHKMYLHELINSNTENLLDKDSLINKSLEVLHSQNKEIVGDLLTTNVKALINFNGNRV